MYLLGHVVCQNYQSFYLFNVFNIVREQSLSLDLKVLPLLFSFHSHSQAIAFGHRALSTIYMCPPNLYVQARTPLSPQNFISDHVLDLSSIWMSHRPLSLTPKPQP